MENQEDQFPSEDLQDDDEQAKLHATISSILNSSLEEKENSACKSVMDENNQDNILEPDAKTLQADTARNNGKTLFQDEGDEGGPFTMEMSSELHGVQDQQDSDRHADFILSTSYSKAPEIQEELILSNDPPTTQELQEEVIDNTESEKNMFNIENSELISAKGQEEHFMEMMDHTVNEETITSSSIIETKQTLKRRGGTLVESVAQENSIDYQTSQEDCSVPDKRPKRDSSEPGDQSNVNVGNQKAELPTQKKRGRPSTKVSEPFFISPDFFEENEGLEKRKSLRAPSKNVQYNEADSSPEKDDKIPFNKDVPKMVKSCDTNSKLRERKEIKASRPAIRVPKDQALLDDDSFFIPEGWLFYAKQRIKPIEERQMFDLYYVTPPSPYRKKIRSRQELISYCTAKGLDYDPLKFFLRGRILRLIKKGVLKYHDQYTVILSSQPEVVEWLPTKGRKQKFIKTEEDFIETPLAQKEIKQSKEISKNVMADSKKNISKSQIFNSTKKISTPKIEPLSPPAKSLNQDKPSHDTKEKPEDKSLAAPPKKKVGRPRRKVAPEPDPPVEEKPVEERVRIRTKLPRRSPYFPSSFSTTEQSKSLAGLRRERKSCDAPPRSPYNLIQEDLFHDPWQMLIATIFLNATKGKIGIPLALEFLKRWPTPQLARQAKVDHIVDCIRSLGFGHTRAATILRFSHEYLTKDWVLPNELYGIGDYGNDSYRIFCMKNEWKKVRSDDPMLMMYLNWRRATEHLRKRFSKTSDPSLESDSGVSSLDSSDSTKKVLRPRAPTPSPIKRRARTK